MNYNKATFDRAFGISAQLPPADGIEIAFAGRSNVGKSSLLNRLFNRKSLARVSSVPGKTSMMWTACTLWICPVTAMPRSLRRRKSGSVS